MEKKSRYTQAQKRAVQKYIAATLEEVRFRVKKGEGGLLRMCAAARGQSVRRYLIEAVNMREGKQILTPPKSGEDAER